MNKNRKDAIKWLSRAIIDLAEGYPVSANKCVQWAEESLDKYKTEYYSEKQ